MYDSDTYLKVIGKIKDLIVILKYLNNYNTNNGRIYFTHMKINFDTETLPKDFNNSFYINDEINVISDKILEENLLLLDDNKEYTVDIKANGPYGRIGTIEEINLFKDLADLSLDVVFDGEIVGGEDIPDDKLEAKYKNKKLEVKCFVCQEEYISDYVEEMKKILPYNQVCELFKIDKNKFDEGDYNSFWWDNGIACSDYHYSSYDEFMNNIEFSKASEKDYKEAMKYVEKLKLIDYCEFFDKNESKYWNVSEYNSVTKEIKKNGQTIKTSDKESALKAIKNGAIPLSKISKELLKDREFVLEAVKINFLVLEFASDELKNDKEIVLNAVRQDDFGDVLQYASKKLQNDKEVVLAAVNANGFALKYASSELRSDREVVLAAAKQCDFIFEFTFPDKKFLNDREFMLDIIETSSHAIVYSSDKLKDDKKFILEAAQKNGLVLKYISKELKSDKEVVMEAIKSNKAALKYASKELKNDEDILKLLRRKKLKAKLS